MKLALIVGRELNKARSIANNPYIYKIQWFSRYRLLNDLKLLRVNHEKGSRKYPTFSYWIRCDIRFRSLSGAELLALSSLWRAATGVFPVEEINLSSYSAVNGISRDYSGKCTGVLDVVSIFIFWFLICRLIARPTFADTWRESA